MSKRESGKVYNSKTEKKEYKSKIKDYRNKSIKPMNTKPKEKKTTVKIISKSPPKASKKKSISKPPPKEHKKVYISTHSTKKLNESPNTKAPSIHDDILKNFINTVSSTQNPMPNKNKFTNDSSSDSELFDIPASEDSSQEIEVPNALEDRICIMLRRYLYRNHEENVLKNVKEEWKDCVTEKFKGEYEISNHGRVRNIRNNQIVKPLLKNNGYLYAIGHFGKGMYQFRINREVALAFIKNDNIFATNVNHKDRNKTNNNFSNLEWVTPRQNNLHAVATGIPNASKTAVLLLYKNGKVKKRFETMRQASAETGVSDARISEICNGIRKPNDTHLYWKYAAEKVNRVKIDPKEEGFVQLKIYKNYWVSKDGKVYSTVTNQFLKQRLRGKHFEVDISVPKTAAEKAMDKKEIQKLKLPKGVRPPVKYTRGYIAKSIFVHILVASCYMMDSKGNHNCVHHKVSPTDNSIKNLEWKTVPGVNPNYKY